MGKISVYSIHPSPLPGSVDGDDLQADGDSYPGGTPHPPAAIAPCRRRAHRVWTASRPAALPNALILLQFFSSLNGLNKVEAKFSSFALEGSQLAILAPSLEGLDPLLDVGLAVSEHGVDQTRKLVGSGLDRH